MPTSPGPLLQALDTTWAHIRKNAPGLPAARIALSPLPPSPNHDQERWAWEGETVTGLVVSAETLDAGADVVLEHILHEAAHVLCWTRGVQDTSTYGTYHNAHYLAAAGEVGLAPPASQARTRGKGNASPTPDTLERYADDLRVLAEAIPLVLPHLVIPEAPSRRRPANRLYLQCQCAPKPRRIQISPTVAAQGPVICGVCGQSFTEA